ncbi:hypothetical protein HanIR_Chr01g0010211 [Helianthus annuus]|nr:hypothetical protein HanIR_Chr01g0010211 [Helianthus annuus]
MVTGGCGGREEAEIVSRDARFASDCDDVSEPDDDDEEREEEEANDDVSEDAEFSGDQFHRNCKQIVIKL